MFNRTEQDKDRTGQGKMGMGGGTFSIIFFSISISEAMNAAAGSSLAQVALVIGCGNTGGVFPIRVIYQVNL